MKKKFGIKIVIGVVLIVLLGVILYNQFIQPFSFENVEYLGHTVEFNNEQEQYLEDFNFAMDTLEQYYPFFEVNKIKNNLDFLRNKENYRSRIKEVKSDKEFGKVLNDIVKELDNYHTHLILDDEMAMSMFYTYGVFSKSLGVTEKGSINELEKTTPHIEVYGDDLRLPLVRQNSIREILKLEDIN